MNERAAAADRDEAGQAATPGLLGEFAQLGRALKHLFGAHWTLFRAELSLARGAVSTLFVAALAATVAGVGLGLTLLALAGVALAAWFGSWLWALALLTKAAVVYTLLETQDLGTFVLAKGIVVPVTNVTCIGLTILIATAVARHEGLLPDRGLWRAGATESMAA